MAHSSWFMDKGARQAPGPRKHLLWRTVLDKVDQYHPHGNVEDAGPLRHRADSGGWQLHCHQLATICRSMIIELPLNCIQLPVMALTKLPLDTAWPSTGIHKNCSELLSTRCSRTQTSDPRLADATDSEASRWNLNRVNLRSNALRFLHARLGSC